MGHATHGARWTTDDELDVRWFLCDAPGLAGGLRSNMGVQIECLRLGLRRREPGYVDAEGAMIDRLDAAARARRVRWCLLAIGAHAAVLGAVYGGELPPPKVRARWGDELGPVVLLLQAEQAKPSEPSRGEAERRLDEARGAYAAAKAGR